MIDAFRGSPFLFRSPGFAITLILFIGLHHLALSICGPALDQPSASGFRTRTSSHDVVHGARKPYHGTLITERTTGVSRSFFLFSDAGYATSDIPSAAAFGLAL